MKSAKPINPAIIKKHQFERYYASIDRSGDCWVWTGYRDRKGYGRLHIGSESGGTACKVGAHRLAWTLANSHEVLLPGLIVCHSCDNPPCVRPTHLFAGTASDNMRDMFSKGRDNHTRGPRNPSTKLTEVDVLLIRSAMGRQEDIGARFGVSQSTVGDIKTRKTWRHI